MAIHNDPMMYRGGAVVFNNQPAVNLYAQTLARKQAREEALDEYERNRINRINEAGLRDQDREGFDQEILGLKSYYSQNKNAIGKKNTPEAYEYEKKFRDVANYIGGSKDLTARAIATEKYRQERMKMGRNTSDELWDDLQKNELPMTDPNHVPIDIAKYQKTQTPKYDQAKSIKMYAGITKMPTTPRYEDIPGRPDLKNEIVEYKFDDAGKNAIRARAEKEFDEDDAFLNIVQSQVNDTIQATRLEKVFEDNFGTKPRNMKDYAVASKMDELQQTSRTEKRVDDWPYRTAEKDKISMRHIGANQRGVSGIGSGQGNLFHKIDLSKYGNPKQGRIDAFPAKDLPADIEAVLKSAGTDISKAQNFTIEIENGDIVAITPNITNGKRVDIVAMANAQEKWNTQGQKQVQPDFEQKIDKVKQPNPGGQNKKPKQKDSLGIRDK